MPKLNPQLNYKNCVTLILDASGSMRPLKNKVMEVFDSQVQHLIKKSKELGQETRVSCYVFSDTVEPVVFDTDCLRVPNIRDFYEIQGNTALIDATLTALSDLQKIPQVVGQLSHLVLVISDGENNVNNRKSSVLAHTIKELPDNFTLACLVPDEDSAKEAESFGFPTNNIQIWETTEKGFETASKTIMAATSNYMAARSSGMKSTKNLFNLDASNLRATDVRNNLEELKSGVEYDLFPVHGNGVNKVQIKPYVESWTQKTYVPGSTYYLLSKPEVIQSYKQLAIQSKRSGKVYAGTKARQLLGLPNYDVKINPSNYGDYDLYAQSTSVNRNLVPGTKIIVMK